MSHSRRVLLESKDADSHSNDTLGLIKGNGPRKMCDRMKPAVYGKRGAAKASHHLLMPVSRTGMTSHASGGGPKKDVNSFDKPISSRHRKPLTDKINQQQGASSAPSKGRHDTTTGRTAIPFSVFLDQDDDASSDDTTVSLSLSPSPKSSVILAAPLNNNKKKRVLLSKAERDSLSFSSSSSQIPPIFVSPARKDNKKSQGNDPSKANKPAKTLDSVARDAGKANRLSGVQADSKTTRPNPAKKRSCPKRHTILFPPNKSKDILVLPEGEIEPDPFALAMVDQPPQILSASQNEHRRALVYVPPRRDQEGEEDPLQAGEAEFVCMGRHPAAPAISGGTGSKKAFTASKIGRA